MPRYNFWGCLVIVACFLASGTETWAAVRVAASCSSADVQTEINASASGDTVRLPGSCSVSWSSVSISGKYITLDGNGATVERSGPQALVVTVNSGGATRVTGFTFTELDDSSFPQNVIIQVLSCTYASGNPNASFRIDHNTFTSDGVTHVIANCHGRGLIDHNTFNWSGNNEVIHVWGNSSDGWTDVVTPGSLDAMYVEDNVFNNTASGNFGAGKTASFYGARTVIRFNTYHSAQVDMHGTAGRVGARWWEIYHNSFEEAADIDKCLQIRAGSGMAFSNTKTSVGNGCTLAFWEEDSGYPATYQVGRGQNQNLTPAYTWSNWTSTITIIEGTINNNTDYYNVTGSFNGTNGMGVGPIASRPATCTHNGAEANSGVGYWATDEGEWWAAHAGPDGRLYKCTATNTWTLFYTPLTYPHPLQTNATDATPPATPADLRIF